MQNQPQPIAPRPPAQPSVRQKITANRRALAVLLREADSSKSDPSADQSGTDGIRAPRRGGRSAAMLKDLSLISTIDDVIDREMQYRGVILSNEVRTFGNITAYKYDNVTIIEEQAVVADAENRQRATLKLQENHERLMTLTTSAKIVEEYVTRCALERCYPPQILVDIHTDIQLRLLRQRERHMRTEVLEPEYELLTRETFGRYLIDQEAWMEWADVRTMVHERMVNERVFLDLQGEERVAHELHEYVMRDALESQMHSSLVQLVGQAHRDLRFLQHHDEQVFEARKRLALQRTEDAEFRSIITRALNERRATAGHQEIARLGVVESKLRRELITSAEEAARILFTQCLREWHRVHDTSRQRTDLFTPTLHCEQFRRVDIDDAYRHGIQELLTAQRTHHHYVAQRDWERRHVREVYLDGRMAIWQQQSLLMDEMYQAHQRQVRLLALTKMSVIIERNEASKRTTLEIEQYKVFLMLHLWHAVQRLKGTSVAAMEMVEVREAKERAQLIHNFVVIGQQIATSPLYSLGNVEETARDALYEDEMGERLALFHRFIYQQRDVTNAVLEVGGLIISSAEAADRRKIQMYEASNVWFVHMKALSSFVQIDRVEVLGAQEALERKLVYSRILDYVGDLHHAALVDEEAAAWTEVENNALFDNELQVRVALLAEEDEHFALIRKLFDTMNAKVMRLLYDEMEIRVELYTEAEVQMTAITTLASCVLPHQRLHVATFQDPQVLRELRMLDSRSFAEDLEKEMFTIRCNDEPSIRRLIVMHEYKQRLVLLSQHHEAYSRQLIQRQESREWAATQETLNRIAARSEAQITDVIRREMDNVETVYRNHEDIEERVALLALLESQDEAYSIAEKQIRYRVLIDEGPLLHEYFRIAEEITAVEEMHRDTIRSSWISEGLVVKQLLASPHRDRQDATSRLQQTPPPTEVSSAQVFLNDKALFPDLPAQLAPDASPPPKMSAPVHTTYYDVVLHSVQVTILSKVLSGNTLMLRGAGTATNEPLSTIAYDETQDIRIGSKVLKVLQPAAPSAWGVDREDGTTVALEVHLGSGNVVLAGSHRVYWEDCEMNQDGLVVMPLVAQGSSVGVVSGKATLILEVR